MIDKLQISGVASSIDLCMVETAVDLTPPFPYKNKNYEEVASLFDAFLYVVHFYQS